MDNITLFFIDLLACPDKLAKFNSGESVAEIENNRRSMLARAGIEDTQDILAMSPKALQQTVQSRLAGQAEQLAKAVALAGDPLPETRPLTASESNVRLTQTASTPETLCTLISHQAQLHPEQTAVIDGEVEITYQHLMTRSGAIASELVSRGVMPGSLVGICLQRSWELATTILGVLRAGCAYLPLDPAYPQERVHYMLSHSQAAAAIVDSPQTAARCAGAPKLIQLHTIPQQAAHQLPQPAAADLAYVIYTSGSTGQPKGVAIAHHNAVAMTRAMHNLLSSEDLSGMLAATSICFDVSVMEILGTLSLGGTVVMANNLLDLPALAAANQIKCCVVVPSAMQALLSSGWVPQGIRSIVFGSEALRLPLAQQVLALQPELRVYNAYGPTEDTVFSTAVEITPNTQSITIGKAVAGSRTYLLDEHMHPVAEGETGELYLAGSKLACGYLHDEVRTRERFIEWEATESVPETRLYKTGDLCRKLTDGQIEFLGRVDHQVKIRGFRVELGEVETALESLPGIAQAAAAAVASATGQKILAAFVVCQDEPLSDEQLKDDLARRMPKYMVPQLIVQLPELPLLPNGKLDRQKLQHTQEASLAIEEQQAAEPGAQQEVTLLSVIQHEVAALLNISDPQLISPNQSFDSLGIDSLTSLELSGRLSRKLGQSLPATVVLEQPTPASLIHFLLKNGSQQGNGKATTPKPIAAPDTLATFQTQIQSSHPTFQAAKVAAWSADDKSKLVQEVLHMVNDQRRNPYSKVLRTGSATRGMVSDAYNEEEQEAIIWTTNLYLGLNRDPEVMDEAAKALQQFGTGMGTSAAASGMTDLHLQFEQEFAELTGKPSACLFPTGYTANVGAVAGILGKNDVVIIDQLCHASIVDGARLCGATIRTFKHNNAADLESVLQAEVSPYRTALVVLEGVYSMGEGAAPVKEIVQMAKKYEALVLVDEAHSFGFYGEGGAGICAAQGITDQVDFIMTTLSKAMGSLGGVVAARQEHVDLMKSASRAYIFQASVSPADMAAALTALRRLRSDVQLRERLWDTTRYMRQQFTEAGYDLGTGDGPIVTPHFSDKDKLYALVQSMYKRGVQTSAVTYPIVEPGRGRLRLICSAAHTRADVDKTLAALQAAEQEVDLQLAASHKASGQLHAILPDLKAWAYDFSASISKQIADSAQQMPNLAISARLPHEKAPVAVLIREQEVRVLSEAPEDLPTCSLLLQDDHAVEALCQSNAQELIRSICAGACQLKGQTEPFVWLIGRMAAQQQATGDIEPSLSKTAEAVY